MNTFIAHAGHPLADSNAATHGFGHLLLLIPLTIAVAGMLLLLAWLVSARPQPETIELKAKK